MKKVLLGSTALIGTALLVQPAAAQLEVTVGGSVIFEAGYTDFDGTGTEGDGADFQSESEIVINARGVADNGLQYGAKVEILTSTNDQGNADEVSLFVGGDWGRLEFGDFDGAADEMQVYAPSVGMGQADGDWDDWAPSSHFFKVRDSGDDTKINYYTPEIAGFRFGVAYAPWVGGPGATGEQVEISNQGQDFETFWELGIAYSTSFGSVDVTATAVYTGANGLNGTDDVSDFAVGLVLGFGDVEVGGNYVYLENGDWGASIGATYSMGPWGFGANYLYNEVDDEDVHTYGVGLEYTLAPGLRLAADVVGFNGHAGDVDGWAAVTQIRAAF